MEKEKLDMYVAPQDYILDAIKDPANLNVEQDIIGEIENFDSIEPTIFDKFTVKASPVEEHIKESKKNESDDEFEDDEDFDRDLTNDELEVGKTYALILDRGQEWILGPAEDIIESEDELKRLKDAGWISEYGEIIVPDEEPFVLKTKGQYGGDTLYFPSVDITFDGLVGGDDDLYYRVESLKKKNEDLPESQEYEFELRQDGVDKYTAISGESEYPIYVAETETLKDAVSDFIDCEFQYDLDDSENIVSTELTFLDFDDEEGKGKFKATIFWGVNESLNEEDMKYPVYFAKIHNEIIRTTSSVDLDNWIKDMQSKYPNEKVETKTINMTLKDYLHIKNKPVTIKDFPKNESVNEDFVSPAEENRLKLYYTDMTKDNTSIKAADKTVEFAKYAFPQLSEDTVRKIAAETYLDICIDSYFEQNPNTEEIPQDKYDEIVADAERMAGCKLSDRYYECRKSKNERGGSDYGSFYNMLADELQNQGFEALKSIARMCNLGFEFSAIANALSEMSDEESKSVNKRSYRIFEAIYKMVQDYQYEIQGTAEYFDSLGKQDNRFDNMITDIFEDFQLSTPNISATDDIVDLVDEIQGTLPESISLTYRGLREVIKIIDSIQAPQGTMGTKKAIKTLLTKEVDKEVTIAKRIIALLKQEWPEGIQPQKRMFRGPQDAQLLADEIHRVLDINVKLRDLGSDAFYIADVFSYNLEDGFEANTKFEACFYFHVPEGKVRVIGTADSIKYGDDYTQEAVYKLPIDINTLAQNAIMLYNDAIKEMENDTKDESLAPYIVEPEKPTVIINDTDFYVVQVLGRDGKWKTICSSLDKEYAYEIYDRWNERIESGDTSLATDVSFSDPHELMYEAMEELTYGK